jgi:KDO2-lipid IV(A) lauroyltransferase
MLRKIRHISEAAVVKAAFVLFRALSVERSSAIGASLGKAIGSKLKVNKVAANNMRNAMPELSEEQIQQNLKLMWENLGRVIGEFPHLKKITGDLFNSIVEVEGAEYVKAAAQEKRTTIFVSGHFANWEFIPKTIYEEGCKDVALVYRRSNNPYLDKLILDTRSSYSADGIPKGAVGARQLIHAIRSGRTIGMLLDQKQNDGIAVPFFHKPAMTAPAIATLALKYNCTIVPIQIVRTNGVKFKVKIHKPLEIIKTENNEQDTYNIMLKINQMFEQFIRENPSQWFWVHNRWPK